MAASRRGFALIAVLLTLLALLVMCAPFLLMARNADRTSTQIFDRAEARLALDSARRHAQIKLSRSYGSLGVDETPDYDSLEELEVDNRFDKGFYNASDPKGTMWDLEVSDLAGFIDLNSAGPLVIANVIGATSRLTEECADSDLDMKVRSTAGFLERGLFWCGGELIRYSEIEQGGSSPQFVKCVRGVEDISDGGPKPAVGHDIGTPVVDQRAFAPVIWRIADAEQGLRRFDSGEQLREAGDFVIEDPTFLRRVDLQSLAALGTVHAGVRGGPDWQRPVRLTNIVNDDNRGQLVVDEVNWFNPGTVIEVTDGQTAEFAIVTEVDRRGRLRLDRYLVNDYEAYETIVRAQVRRPVNINTASIRVLVALFTNLQLRQTNSRITGREAKALANLVLESRPFDGHEDFVRRVVLPAAGIEELPSEAEIVPDALPADGAIIDPHDALALYRNGRNANDIWLQYSTMPFAYKSRDVYALDLRSTVNAKSGVQRTSARREVVDLIVPQQELLHAWTRQVDYDEELRLTRRAHWWMSGPFSTSPYDFGASPPSRVWAHMGTYEGLPYLPGVANLPDDAEFETPPAAEHVFASREERGYAQLWPSRLEDTGRVRGRSEHFDFEVSDPEGRYLPESPYEIPVDDDKVLWTDQNAPFMRAPAIQMWIRPRSLADATFFDVGHSSSDSDRISLLFEEGDLVLRLLDATGDHPNSVQEEFAELRYSQASGQGPGLPIDTWHHVAIDVRGSRPDQMTMLVNGLTHGVRAQGLSRLTTDVSQLQDFFPLESTEGFSDVGVARVGYELFEYQLEAGGLRVVHNETGPLAGFGGRIARQQHDAGDPQDPNGDTLHSDIQLDVDHAAGTPVAQYGYSLPTASRIPNGEAALRESLGAFRIAKLQSVLGAPNDEGDPVEIQVQSLAGVAVSITIGYGLDESGPLDLMLGSGDDWTEGVDATEYMQAFNPEGGYAALVQINWGWGGTTNAGQFLPRGGVEIFRYSGWDGNILHMSARGDSISELSGRPELAAAFGNPLIGGKRGFIANYTWDQNWNQDMRMGAYVMPISIPVPGAGSPDAFLNPGPVGTGETLSEFAQLTHIQDAELTEWVRYDAYEMSFAQLVRVDGPAFEAVLDTIVNSRTRQLGSGATPTTPQGPQNPQNPSTPGTSPGGQGTGPTTGPGTAGGGSAMLMAAPAPLPQPALLSSSAAGPVAASATGLIGSVWDPQLGEPGDLERPLSRAVRLRLQFRGVFGTETQTHPAGTPVLPVFRVWTGGPDVGRPGRLDNAFLVGDDFTHLGWPVTVHLAHYPSIQYRVEGWNADPSVPVASADPSGNELLSFAANDFNRGEAYVALQEASPELMEPGSSTCNPNGTSNFIDTRCITRITKFPSGERPRIVSQCTLGGGFQQGAGVVPAAVVDEVVFGDARFANNVPEYDDEQTKGAALVLREEIDDEEDLLLVWPNQVRIPLGRIQSLKVFLDDTPEDAGLLRMGEEIMAYSSRDPEQGEIVIAEAGRGLLGTQPQPHAPGEAITFLEHFSVSVLTRSMSQDDATIPVSDLEGFPRHGTVLIGGELMHFTRQRQDALEMPRLSKQAGAMDSRGAGMFRGRYGTLPSAHAEGEAVILFPFRYWDRWEARADAPELSYMQLALEQPAAFWRSLFWTTDALQADGPRIGVLQRSDPEVPWDADPEQHDGLRLFYEGLAEGGGPLPLGVQADGIEWRVFVEYPPEAFDLETGSSHAWHQTPQLDMFGAFYVAPSIPLRSLER